MEVLSFTEISSEFLTRVSQAVYCSMATVDHLNRPRSRIMHPVWDGPIGWVISWPASHKARQLARNPHISLAYIHATEKPVYVDCTAEWVDEPLEKQRIWELHRSLPGLLGFDPLPHYGSIDNPYYGLLKFIPWRIELANLGGEPLVWRNPRQN